MSGHFCTGFIYFMLKDKSLLEYTNLFSPNEYKMSDKILLKYFEQRKSNVMFAINIENLKKLKHYILLRKN